MSISDQPLLKSPGVQSLSIVSTPNMMERGLSSPGSMSRLTFMGRETGTDKTIAALGVLSILSLLQSILAVILLVRFDLKQDEFQNFTNNVIQLDEGLYESMLDSGMVLASFCVMLNFCCLVVCMIQCYFAAKMMKLPQGEERAYKFLSNTSGGRFIVISAFFASIPVFLAALCLYLLIEFRFIPAIVSSSFIGLGIIFTIFCFSRSVHLWRIEQKRVSKGLNVYEPSTPPGHLDHHGIPITMINNGYIHGGLANGELPNIGLNHTNGVNNNGVTKPVVANGKLPNGGLNINNGELSDRGSVNRGSINGGSANSGSVNSGQVNGMHYNPQTQDIFIDRLDDNTDGRTPMFYANHVGNGDALNTSNLSTLV